MRMSGRCYPAAVQAEARRVAASQRRFAVPVSEDTLREWLAVFPLSVRNTKTPDALAGWVTVVAKAVRHLETGAFTDATQNFALQQFKMFPSAADVYEIVAPAAVEIRQRLFHLDRIANGPTTPGEGAA
jgi:hypothetical protein